MLIDYFDWKKKRSSSKEKYVLVMFKSISDKINLVMCVIFASCRCSLSLSREREQKTQAYSHREIVGRFRIDLTIVLDMRD